MPSWRTEHNLEPGRGTVGHQIRLAGGGSERGFDIEQARFWVCRKRLCDGAQRLAVSVAERGLDIERARFRICRQYLCDNGGDGADIAGAVGKQHGVTVLEGKRHDARIASRSPKSSNVGRWNFMLSQQLTTGKAGFVSGLLC